MTVAWFAAGAATLPRRMVAPAHRAAWPPWTENRRAGLAAAAAAAALGALALFGRGAGRPDLLAAGKAAVVVAWFALLMAGIRLPPRPRARRERGRAVLRASLLRRLSTPLLLAPVLGLVAWRIQADQPGAVGLALAGLLGAAVALLVLSALRHRREFVLRVDGLEAHAGRGAAFLPWAGIRAVRVEAWRRHAGLVLLGGEGSPSFGVSAWLDGSAELAAALLAHAPAEALAGAGVREALEALAGELEKRR